MGLTLSEAVERFREHGGDSEAAAIYISLMEGAQARWQSAVELHDWRLDVLAFRRPGDGSQQVQVEYRRRDGEPIVVFSLGPVDTMAAAPVVTGDICRSETAPNVLDAFRMQIAEPSS